MNKLLTIILSILLSLPIMVWAVDNTVADSPNNATEQIENRIDEDIENEEVEYKQPISKKKIAKKFLIAMTSVVASSIFLYLMLTIYNRIRENIINQVKTLDGETSLETPQDLENAVKTFLDKTKWS